MKKSLSALAVLLASGSGAYAQSSVTLFGVVDATITYGSGSVSKKTRLHNSGYASSRIGFRGTEDLGGGLSAGFWLEAGVNSDDGTGQATNTNNQATGGAIAGIGGGQGLTFNRVSYVSLGGPMGELRLGRDYTPQFRSHGAYDPFGLLGVGNSQAYNSISPFIGATAARSSNSIGYLLPHSLGGVFGQFMYYLGENNSGAATSKDGNGWGARVGFAKGPFQVAVAASRTRYAAGDVSQNNIGAFYDFGVVKIEGLYGIDKTDVLGGKGRGYLAGAIVPVGLGLLRASYSRYKYDAGTDPTSGKLAVGYVHNLSKRTAVYATYAAIKNSGGAAQALNGAVTAANASSRGFDLGVTHSF